MELGAVICTPASPRCGECPLARGCHARREGRQHEIPPPKRSPTPRAAHHHTVLVERAGTLLLEQRPATGLWSKMWQAPTIESETPLRRSALAKRWSFARGLSKCGRMSHSTTHRRITFHVYRATTGTRAGVWRRPDQIAELPMSNAQRRIIGAFAAGAAAGNG
jgi:A/G-specific adenine glycosylase